MMSHNDIPYFFQLVRLTLAPSGVPETMVPKVTMNLHTFQVQVMIIHNLDHLGLALSYDSQFLCLTLW